MYLFETYTLRLEMYVPEGLAVLERATKMEAKRFVSSALAAIIITPNGGLRSRLQSKDSHWLHTLFAVSITIYMSRRRRGTEESMIIPSYSMDGRSVASKITDDGIGHCVDCRVDVVRRLSTEAKERKCTVLVLVLGVPLRRLIARKTRGSASIFRLQTLLVSIVLVRRTGT
jgi:hypothetical protein